MNNRNDWARSVRGWGYAALALLVLAAPAAWAMPEVCVSTEAELIEAMANVRYTAATIKIVKGTYDIENSLWYYGSNNFMQPGTSLRGGYFFNCVAREVAAGNTVLTETNVQEGTDLAIAGSFTLDGLTLELEHGFFAFAGDDVYPIPPGTTILISRSVIRGGQTHFQSPFNISWSVDPDRGGEIRIVDTLVTGNNSDAGDPSVEILVYEGTPTITFTNDTVVGNASGVHIYNNPDGDNGGGAVLLAHNNIF